MSAPGLVTMKDGTEFDLWANAHEPVVKERWTTYQIRLPDQIQMQLRTGDTPHVYVQVDEYGMVNLDRSYTIWFGEKLNKDATRNVGTMTKEIYQWLIEWEFIRWMRIGPEDSELFALKKLTGEDYEWERHD